MVTDVGLVEIVVLRDREGTFEPRIVRKRACRLSGVEDVVIWPAAKGLTTGEIQVYLGEL